VAEELEPTAESEEAASATAMITIEHMFEIWIEPELKRRGVTPDDLRVRKALVVLKRDQPPVVMINAEFELVASVRATRDIAEGEDIYASDFDEVHSIKPVDVDEDAGWITFFAVPDGRLYLAFDFRYELGRSRGVLARADEFIASARDDLTSDRPGPAIDNAFAAAELAVMVQMRTHVAPENPRNRHGSRYTWFEGWARLGNAQSQHAEAIRRLEQLRGWARYADDNVPGPRDGEVARLLRDVHELIEDTRVLVAARPLEP
jgi:hypothetical protein